MSGLFGGSTPDIPAQQPSQVLTKDVDLSAENAAQFERSRKAAAFGRQKTLLTSGRDLGTPLIQRKTLLGGGMA